MIEIIEQFAGLSISDMEAVIRAMPAGDRKLLEEIAQRDYANWRPLPGPQSEAYYSTADVIGYGGAAGGGKTDLMCGLSLCRHRRALIARKDGQQLFGIRERLGDILGTNDGWNGQDRVWRHPKGVIELRGVPHLGDEKKMQGRPHGLKGFDEATEMLEAQVRFIMGWMRSEDEAVRPQALLTFNPPTTIEGRWIIKYFAPWLDKKHPNRAEPGELRLFTTIAGEDIETEDDRPFVLFGGEQVFDFDPADFSPEEIVEPKSRTFIPSKVSDNPYYMRTGYIATVQAMPEPLRSQMLYGDFEAGMEDDKWQVIPTAWIEAAMDRWQSRARKGQMDSMGVDPAMGGSDKFVIARRHGTWFDDLLVIPGKDVPDGPTGAGLCIAARRDQAPIHIDVIGWGSSTYDFLNSNDVHAVKINGASKSFEVSRDAGMRFANLRAELVWRMREALDPAAKDPLALPDDADLLADLAAYRYKVTTLGILIGSKEDMIKEIGRSPDKGDAACYALVSTMKRATLQEQFNEQVTDRSYDRFNELGL